MAARRHLPGLALAGACLPLAVAWLSAPSPNCSLAGGTGNYCYLFGWPRVWAWTALALPAGLVVAGVAALVPQRWVDAAIRGPATRTLLAPERGALLALGPVVLAAAALAPPLFAGEVTARATVWAVLALPYLPFLAGSAALFWLTGAVPGQVVTAALLPVGLAVAVAQATWLLAIARAAYAVASYRNSASE